ncbi:OLC1v1030803C1 [Oldenlandia corymbosa var. corymbosa]|uniref:Target of rapamycin complex subunit LST8 n=1 Tax=Oldenlandia corymbosa var. corymbosa TaxID=529605 RepID=A0AAV1CHL6_OLDCO|nr:OLC1v1030803C1 [Oldenlandia corymbosa var. corymbosa]
MYISELKLATASSDHTVKIWNVDGFTLEKTLVGHQHWVWDCVFSVDGAYLITASSDTTARLWSKSSGEQVKTSECTKGIIKLPCAVLSMMVPNLPPEDEYTQRHELRKP